MKNSFEAQISEYLEYISDAKYIEECCYFINVAKNYLKTLSMGDKKEVGINNCSFPEVLIRGCGAKPIYLMGGYEGVSSEVDDIFPQISDSVVKSNTNFLLNEEFKLNQKLNCIVYEITNDSERKIPYYLKEAGYKVIKSEKEQLIFNNPPRSFKRKQREQLKQLMWKTKTPITKRKLISSMKKITKANKLFKEIEKLDIETRLKNFIRETYYLSPEIDKWIEETEKLLKRIPKNEEESSLVVVGSEILFPNYKIGAILHEVGLINYSSKCSVPYPYDYSEISTKDTLIGILRKVYNLHYKKIYSSQAVGNSEITFNSDTKAVIFHLLKGQLLSAYYADKVEKNCIENNIPYLCIETDYTKADKEQIKIRIEAFMELLNIRDSSRRSWEDEKQMA